MAHFPAIDCPCPLGIEEQLRIDGYCNRCEKSVHSLDAMSDAGRAALLAQASGPICVSYRRNARIAGLAAVAITLVAGSAFAGEQCADTSASSLLPVVQAPMTPVASADAAEADEELTDVDLIVVMGGISNPQDAQWIDDSDLPELPMQAEEPKPASAGR